MKQSLNFTTNIVRSIATLIVVAFAASASLKAQPNQPIKITAIPQAILTQMALIDTKTVNLETKTLGAPLNSVLNGTFKVPADGAIVLKLTFDHKGNLPVNHTVRIELRNPNNVIVASINEFIVVHNVIKTATLTATASTAMSGCFGSLNMWSYKVINNDNVNHQATLVGGTIKTPDATGFRTVFPSGGFTLVQNNPQDFVFQTPKGHNGEMRIKVLYTDGSPATPENMETRLFKPNVEPSPNEANAVHIKTITANGESFAIRVSANDVSAANHFWTLRLRNKLGVQVINARITVEFTDCFE